MRTQELIKAEYSLREKKCARTKIVIMNAFLELLRHNSFDKISIKKISEKAEVAEGTFFNYFPEKIDVIGYYLHLTTSKLVWKTREKVPEGKYLPLIDYVISRMPEELNSNSLIYQIIAIVLVQTKRPKKVVISVLEKAMAFPDYPGIENMPIVSLDEWFRECLIKAQTSGELPVKANINDMVISIMTIISGTLLAVKFNDSNNLSYHYKRQLQALWRDVGVREKK